MEKQEILDAIKKLSDEGQLTREEVLSVLGSDQTEIDRPKVSDVVDRQEDAKHFDVSDILYYIGGGIVFLGIAVMVYGSWNRFGDFGRAAVTLGSALLFYVIAVFLNDSKKFGGVSVSFFLASALVLPIGLFVILSNAGLTSYASGTNILVSAIVFIVAMVSYFSFKKNVMVIFAILYGSWLFMAITSYLLSNATTGYEVSIYRIMALGLSYISLGYAFSSKETLRLLRGWLYGFGALVFLGSTLSLTGAIWDVLYPGFVFGIIFLSIQTKAKSFLVFGSIFLMAYIVKITAMRFSSGLGWPAALMLAGICLIAIGYYAFYINRKYLAKNI